ncbi:MAG: hypothetical protein IPL61_33480 [Myxococcales bacterium]|nr:hypothetical protein [Myxococcales bacterium]
MTIRAVLFTAALAATLAACGGAAKPTVGNSASADAAYPVAVLEPLERTVPATEDEPDGTVRLPRVTVPGNPTASAAITAALGTPATADQLDAHGEVGIDYVVGHNADGLLDVRIVHETLGAYADTYEEHFLFDTTTGARLTAAQLFRADALPTLAARVDAQLQAELTAARADRPDCVDGDDDPFHGEFTVAHLDSVGVSDGRVGFTYDYDFPHVIAACEPSGGFWFKPAELDEYLAPDSALRRLAR